jgi:hypothetical protein
MQYKREMDQLYQISLCNTCCHMFPDQHTPKDIIQADSCVIPEDQNQYIFPMNIYFLESYSNPGCTASSSNRAELCFQNHIAKLKINKQHMPCLVG